MKAHEPVGPKPERRELFQLVIRIALIIFLVEAIIMVAISGWQFSSAVIREGLIDAVSLTLISSPLIYLWVARPFVKTAQSARAALADELDIKASQARQLEIALEQSRMLLGQNEELRQVLKLANQSSAKSSERALQKIGADLHDGPAQLLSYAMLRFDKLADAVHHTLTEREVNELTHLRLSLADSLKEVRYISTGLLPPGLEQANLREAVLMAISLHEQHTGTAVTRFISADPSTICEHLKVCTYRVIQEALTNAYRHANGNNQVVKVECDNRLRLEISDDGSGFEPDVAIETGLGLTGMKSRVEALGGRLSIASRPGKGTKVLAEFDLA
jgi:signal transduction histidine kinase